MGHASINSELEQGRWSHPWHKKKNTNSSIKNIAKMYSIKYKFYWYKLSFGFYQTLSFDEPMKHFLV
jgi:hypothetical protein